jgi:hypothetical protein
MEHGQTMKALRLALATALAAFSLWAADVTGKWTAEMQGPGGNTRTVTMNLKADGNKLTGTVSGGRGGEAEISDGKVDGNDLSFSVVREFNGNKMASTYKGKMDGDVIHFTMKMEGGNMGNMGERQFDAKRAS